MHFAERPPQGVGLSFKGASPNIINHDSLHHIHRDYYSFEWVSSMQEMLLIAQDITLLIWR